MKTMTKAIQIRVLHVISETDYEPYHRWSLEGWSTPHDDEKTIMTEAKRCVDGLLAAGIAAEIKVDTLRQPYPRSF